MDFAGDVKEAPIEGNVVEAGVFAKTEMWV